MRLRTLVLSALLVAGTTHASPTAPKDPPAAPAEPAATVKGVPDARALFDLDADGKVTDLEADAVRHALGWSDTADRASDAPKVAAAVLAVQTRLDGDSDGEVSEVELEVARQAWVGFREKTLRGLGLSTRLDALRQAKAELGVAQEEEGADVAAAAEAVKVARAALRKAERLARDAALEGRPAGG